LALPENSNPSPTNTVGKAGVLERLKSGAPFLFETMTHHRLTAASTV
jgi:hypothetical protein